MHGAAALGFAVVLLLATRGSAANVSTPNDPHGPQSPRHASIRALITRTAKRYGVDPHTALVFAWLESRFDPGARGDLEWSSRKGGELYRNLVRDAPRMADNPARLVPKVWHSYGLFQLLAPYHVQPQEHPQVLLNPVVNASRGVLFIRRLLEQTRGDVDRARLLYTGAANLPAEVTGPLLDKLHQAQQEVIV